MKESLLEIYAPAELDDILTRYSLEDVYSYSLPVEVAIKDIKNEVLDNSPIYVSSPDGFVRVSDWVDKGEWEEYLVSHEFGEVRVNENHLFETTRGWLLTKDIGPDDEVLHEIGEFIPVTVTKTGNRIPIVDVQIDHENHRYYTGGLCSHNTNVGKSALMCYLAGEWMRMGKNVLYITMEMSEEAVQERIDANLLDITTDQLKNPDLDKSWFAEKIAKLKSKTVGKLIVKEFPTGAAHSGHFRHVMRELDQKKKVKPDIVFIDYINICSSSRYKAGAVNTYSYIKAIAEELRGLAVEFEVPFFTATQVNREGMNSQSPDMTATSDSFGLPMSLDWFAAIVTNEELMEMGRQVIIPLKSRFGNRAKINKQIIRIDFDKMRYSDLPNDSTEELINTVGQRKPSGSPTKDKQSNIPKDIMWDD